VRTFLKRSGAGTASTYASGYDSDAVPRRLTRARVRSGLSRVRDNLQTRGRPAALAVNASAFSGRSGSPANFADWLERGQGRSGGSYPDEWRARTDLRLVAPARVGVVLHVFYRELLDEMLLGLAAIPVAFDLIVTNATGSSLPIDGASLPRMANLTILEVENRGRDILPLVSLVNAGLLDPYLVVLKVHTKRSAWRDRHQLDGSGAEWRKQLLDQLLGDAANVAAILSAFANSPDLGIVTADGSVLGATYWGDNQVVAANLLRRLELDLPVDLEFAAGSMYWVRGFVLQGLRAAGLSEADFEPEAGQVNGTTAHAIERVVGIVAAEAGLALRERSQLTDASDATAWQRFEIDRPAQPRVRVVPFYLPQFHAIPENDRWWGKGFTEWTNVIAARPIFPGHDQPKLPADLGFYDLRLRDTVAAQAALAEMAAIGGFMYYHYWFAGKQLLERPILDRLQGDVALPFCLMWANENWTRRWDGRESDILVGQHYEEVPAARFIDDVMPILKDGRYMKVDGRAILAVYRPGQIPDLPQVIASWREAARRAGVGEILVLGVDVAREFHGVGDGANRAGLDGRLGFPPHNALWKWASRRQFGPARGFSGRFLSYSATARDAIRKLNAGLPGDYYPGVMVGFDNTARRQLNPDIWYGSNPYTFRRWLSAAAKAVADREPDRRLVFVNAWNEWAEGAMLEPSLRMGSTCLLAVRDIALG
jgi:lipopolysaccharide biosynthesis protein